MRERLIELLNSLEYYVSNDGTEYTPKSQFIEYYDKLVTDAESYFKEIEADIFLDGSELLADERELFYGADTKEQGAFEVIKYAIDLLQGGTLEYKQKTIHSLQHRGSLAK